METPICDFIKKYNEKDFSRFHMPGHKGMPILGCENIDITEIDEGDDLACPSGIIKQSEENAAKIFGTRKTCFSVGGSSQSIKAMLHLATIYSKTDSYTIIAARNAHKAFLHGVALLDIDTIWLYPKNTQSLCSCDIDILELEDLLKNAAIPPIGVFITSPDYLGNMADIKGISQVCKRYDIPLLVDNAHGSYLKLLNPSLHPLDMGADICCDSAHKTLPVLTGGGYLHLSKTACRSFEREAKSSMSIFGSSSPSYLILQSLDYCNKIIAQGFSQRLDNTVDIVRRVISILREKGVIILDSDPLRIVFDCSAMGYKGIEIKNILNKHSIECEFCDVRFLVLMITPYNTQKDFDRLISSFEGFIIKEKIQTDEINIMPNKKGMSVRKALMSKNKNIPVEKALNRIAATPVVSCPPAVPIIISGEIITSQAIELLKYYEKTTIEVVEE